ncbi:sugar ABC transporter ATP-binding protein [bacterium]|nr:sugar ABC transporter ATP-binding protein [bacterium]MDA7680504.1 sugar ABC transporter ATP-binding protein [bacterium]
MIELRDGNSSALVNRLVTPDLIVTLVKISDLSKSYGGVQALRDIHLEISPGEIHALCGENGAGKSTLIKILGGIVRPDSGGVEFSGAQLVLGSVRAAEMAGITVIHQESVAFPHLNAVDNLFVGRELREFGWLLDRKGMKDKTREILSQLGESIDVERPMEEFPLAQRQMVAIARALLQDCRLLVMDEPTASLSEKETEVLFEKIRQLRKNGVSVLYVSHRLHEIFELADRVTVFRDGLWVSTDPCDAIDEGTLIQRMVGRSIGWPGNESIERSDVEHPLLTIRTLSRASLFDNISLEVYPGEIVGLGGLVGAGRSEVARCVFGVDVYDSGSVEIDGQPLLPGSVRSSCESGVALVPEDRQHEGLIQAMSIHENFGLPWLKDKSRYGFLNRSALRDLSEEGIKSLDVRLGSASDPVSSLSGGNQQKVVLGKWLAGNPKVLILDEPTRGVDVGAKEEVYRLIRSLAGKGVAILLISSDLPELIRLSDRIAVMCDGRIRGELDGEEICEEAVLKLALPEPVAHSNDKQGSE